MRRKIMNCFVLMFCLVLTNPGIVYGDWPTLAANPERTSCVSEEIKGILAVNWYRPIEPYINPKVQVILADGKAFISTAKGLYALDAGNGAELWVYPTDMPLGHSPTYDNGYLYVGGYDRKIHKVDANSGQPASGWNSYEADSGFETNPLIINGRVYAGCRDGRFYCLDANTGGFIWAYPQLSNPPLGPICFSPAYKDGVFFFASNDSHAYAVDTNGNQVWKSAKLPGAGFYSYWAVIYQGYVIFSGSPHYNRAADIASPHMNCNLTTLNVLYTMDDLPNGSLIGPTGNEPGDWASGTMTMDASRIINYYEDYPDHRRYFVLDRTNGNEYTFNSDNDGKMEYAPILFYGGSTCSGNKYPPVIGGDGVLYQNVVYEKQQYISGGDIVGWKFGTQYFSRLAEDVNAGDECMAFAFGGDVVYWSLCCGREGGSMDTSVPWGGGNREWNYYMYDIRSKAPGHNIQYYGDEYNGWGLFGGLNGVYGKHGNQNPIIPYNNKTYIQMSNCVIAWATSGGSGAPLPMAETEQAEKYFSPVSASDLKQKLEEEIQKMINAGHLRPGYHICSIFDWSMFPQPMYGNSGYGDYLVDYFHNPADTLYALIRALPHLSPTLQNQTRTYLQNEFANYPATTITHIGWDNGAQREAFDEPLDYKYFVSQSHIYQGPPKTSSWSGEWWNSYPQDSFYGLWKYAEEFGGADTIYNQVKNKIESPPVDSYLALHPWIHNAYIMGHIGYLELEKLAEYPETSSVRTELNRLLNLRAIDFSKDSPFPGPNPDEWIPTLYDYPNSTGVDAIYRRCLNVARNFMFLVPELGDYMYENAFDKVKEAVDDYERVAPYWFVSKYDAAGGESSLQHLFDYPAIFHAKAWILKAPYEELAKYIDVPAFEVGDLFYIHNLVTAIEAIPVTATNVILTANPGVIQGDGSSTSVITAKVCDINGYVATTSNAEITFSLNGSGTLVDNNPVNASAGIAIITYRAGTQEETVTITATSSGLTEGSVNVGVVVNDPPDQPTNLLCNSQNNPVGIGSPTMEFTWLFSDPDISFNDSQTAYRLLIADSLSALNSNNGNIWDTNKVESSGNNVEYTNTQLTAGATYYWKVTTWDSFDVSGQYSQPATFTMSEIFSAMISNASSWQSKSFTNQTGQFTIQFDLKPLQRPMNGVTGLANGNAGQYSDMACIIAIQSDQTGDWLNIRDGGTYRFDNGISYQADTVYHVRMDVNIGTKKYSVTVTPQGQSPVAVATDYNFRTDQAGVTQLNTINVYAQSGNHEVYNIYLGGGSPPPPPPQITVSSPNGGETWITGEQKTVTWTSQGSVGNVNIDISTDAGTNWTNLISNTANDGSQTITVPNSPGTNCRIRVQEADGSPSDISNNNFTITAPQQPTIIVTSPNGGETWTINTNKVITWTSIGSVGNVNIDLTTDGGSNWTNLVSDTSNDGSQTITVPDSPSTTCKIRIRDVSGSPSDTSNSNFTITIVEPPPVISIDISTLEFGEVEIGNRATLDFTITNTGGGILSGSISTDKKWIEVSPTSFNDNNVTVNVTVDNSVLNQNTGQYTGKITITSNGGNISVEVTLKATCVLAKPNPYDPTKGNLTFFGDGIVPNQTTIRIYTLDGELIKTLSNVEGTLVPQLFASKEASTSEIIWNGKNENGEEVTNGIYIYVYESPKEQGVNKFTVINE